MMRVRDMEGNASSPPYRRVQLDVKAWLLDCFRRWRVRAYLATVWSVCVMVVAFAAGKEFDRGQYGYWESAVAYALVRVVLLVALALWAIAFHVAHTHRWAPMQLVAEVCMPARRTSAQL